MELAADAAITALVGPSGAGKTTVLNCIAGLLRPDRGRIAVGGTALFDSALGVNLPPECRRAGYVFQDARLFPHLRVEANLRYGERLARPEERTFDSRNLHLHDLVIADDLRGRGLGSRLVRHLTETAARLSSGSQYESA